jgi:hypothetical protein
MPENISPEEKLLRLIRGQKSNDKDATAEDKPLSSAVELRSPVAAVSLKPLVKKKFVLRPQLALSWKRYTTFFSLKRGLWALFVLACLYLFVSLVWGWWGQKKVELPPLKLENFTTPEITSDRSKEIKPYEYYLEGTRNRQIFKGTAGREGQSQQPASAINLDLTKDIVLVGIVSGENPQAVLEDKKTQRTYYVSKGQMIGEIQVAEILQGKIILNYRGQKYELYL